MNRAANTTTGLAATPNTASGGPSPSMSGRTMKVGTVTLALYCLMAVGTAILTASVSRLPVRRRPA